MIGHLLALSLALHQDTLTLARAHALAAARDPRQAKVTLAATATEARLASSALERKPQLALRAEASHQSDVTALPVSLPGVSSNRPPRDRIQTTLNVEQLLYDAGSRVARDQVEIARLSETEASVAVSSYAIMSEVDRYFFASWTAQERVNSLDAVAADLAGRLAAARVRVQQGVALPRDTAAVEAERLSVLQWRDDAISERATALQLLQQLTGLTSATPPLLVFPSLDAATARLTPMQVRDSLATRPEFVLLRRTDARLQAERELTSAVNRPRVMAFGQGGIGRPGLNQFETSLAGFWVAGVKLEWRPFTWGSAALAGRALAAQQESLQADAAALSESLTRAATVDLARIARVRASLEVNDKIVSLRGVVANTARIQFDEGVMTASDYLSARTAFLDAQLKAQAERTELAQLQATLLTTLGITIP